MVSSAKRMLSGGTNSGGRIYEQRKLLALRVASAIIEMQHVVFRNS